MLHQHKPDKLSSNITDRGPFGGGGWALLKDRNFGPLWAGQLVSQIGDSLNRVALLWFVYHLTGSTLKTSLIGLLQTIPPLLLSPVIGVFLDRLPKKPVMLSVDVIRAGLVLVIPLLHLMGALTLSRLYLLVFCISIFSTIFGPALASSVPFLVGRSHLTSANALLQTTTNVGLLAGPAIGGAGIAFVGPENVLYLNVATFLISALCLAPVKVRDKPAQSRAPRAAC
jgi:predicted MFS family arabinose efflux permease